MKSLKENWIKSIKQLNQKCSIYYCNLRIYDLYRLIFFIDEILAVYLPHPGLFSYEVQAKIGGICINYMHICYANNAL